MVKKNPKMLHFAKIILLYIFPLTKIFYSLIEILLFDIIHQNPADLDQEYSTPGSGCGGLESWSYQRI